MDACDGCMGWMHAMDGAWDTWDGCVMCDVCDECMGWMYGMDAWDE